jgi:hypothetical protein
MTDKWRAARRAAHRAALREVAEALGGDQEAYVIAGYLARHHRHIGGSITTTAQLLTLERPEEVVGLGNTRARRVYDWQEHQRHPRG